MSRIRDSDNPPAGPVPADLVLRVGIAGGSTPEGTPIRIEGTFINRTGRRLVVWGEDDAHAWTYRFGDAWVAEFAGLPPAAPPPPHVLEPDAQRMVRAVLDQHVHFRHAGGAVRRHLPAGTYALTVSVRLARQDPSEPLGYEGEVVAEPVLLTVTPRATVPFERPGVSLGSGAPGAFQNDREHLTMLAAMASAEPRVLPVIVHQVRRMVAFGSLLDLPPRELLEIAWLGSDAGAAAFGGLSEDAGRRDARLGDRVVSFLVPVWPTGGRDLLWLHAFELAAMARNADAQRVLLQVPIAELSASGGPNSLRLRHIEAVRAVALREPAAEAIKALAAATTGEDGALARARAAALAALVAEDLPALDAAMFDLLQAFREAHFQADATPSPDALLCFEALALASEADARGLPLGVISEFMPSRLLIRPD